MDLGRIAVGQKVSFSDQEDSERRRTGRVKEIGRAVAGNQRQNTVKLVIEPLEAIDDLRLNQQLYVEFVTREEEAVLRVPRELVYERGGQRLVNVLTPEGARPRPIRTAPGDAAFDKVLGGIGAADRLLPRNAVQGMAR
jgi:multidrug efflux pump subunit AcrA (membrane-fusion protein)